MLLGQTALGGTDSTLQGEAFMPGCRGAGKSEGMSRAQGGVRLGVAGRGERGVQGLPHSKGQSRAVGWGSEAESGLRSQRLTLLSQLCRDPAVGVRNAEEA